MKYNPEIHHRKSIRIKEYDYSQSGYYFVTICAYNRENLFGKIVDGKIELTYSSIAEKERMAGYDLIRKNADKNADNISQIQGDIVECGVWRGGFSIFLSKTFPKKTIWVCDSFEGFQPLEKAKFELASKKYDSLIDMTPRLNDKNYGAWYKQVVENFPLAAATLPTTYDRQTVAMLGLKAADLKPQVLQQHFGDTSRFVRVGATGGAEVVPGSEVTGPGKQKIVDLKAAADKLAILADPGKSPLDTEGQKKAAQDLAMITSMMAKMGGADLGGISTPPPGAVRLKQ